MLRPQDSEAPGNGSAHGPALAARGIQMPAMQQNAHLPEDTAVPRAKPPARGAAAAAVPAMPTTLQLQQCTHRPLDLPPARARTSHTRVRRMRKIVSQQST